MVAARVRMTAVAVGLRAAFRGHLQARRIAPTGSRIGVVDHGSVRRLGVLGVAVSAMANGAAERHRVRGAHFFDAFVTGEALLPLLPVQPGHRRSRSAGGLEFLHPGRGRLGVGRSRAEP